MERKKSQILLPMKKRLTSLNSKAMMLIFSFINIKETMEICLFSANRSIINLHEKYFKLRHYKILLFLSLFFYKNTNSINIFQYLFKDNNYTSIRNKFKILPEKDLLKGLSLFLTAIYQNNHFNNIFYVKFSNSESIDFINNFLQIHRVKDMRLIIDVNKQFSFNFYQFLTSNNINIEEFNLLPNSKHIKKIFDYKNFKYAIKTLRVVYIPKYAKYIDILKNYFFNNKNSIKELEIIEHKDFSTSNSKDEFLNLIEFNSDTITSLKLDFSFQNFEKLNKTLSRCRFLKKFHICFKTQVMNSLIKSELSQFCSSLSLCKSIEDFSLDLKMLMNAEIAEVIKNLKHINMIKLCIDLEEIIILLKDSEIQKDCNFLNIFSSFSNLNKIVIEFTNNLNYSDFAFSKYFFIYKSFIDSILPIEILEVIINFDISMIQKFDLNHLILCILENEHLNFLSTFKFHTPNNDIKLNTEVCNLLYQFIYRNQIISYVEISSNKSIDELVCLNELNVPYFIIRCQTINEIILNCFAVLFEKQNSSFKKQHQMYFKGKISIFNDFFKHFYNFKYFELLRGISFQYEIVQVETAYKLRDLLHKVEFIELLEFKSLVLKIDLFDIICNKISFKNLKNLYFCEISNLEEKSLLKFFKVINTRNISKIIINNLNMGDPFLEFISLNKANFTKLVSIDFRTNRKLVRGLDFIFKVLQDNYFLFEVILNKAAIGDNQKLTKLVNNYRFTKFVIV
jgi:hypothetical protein